MADGNMVVYTAKEVQKILQCSKSQSYKIMNARIFPSFQLGKRLYVTREDFEKFLKQCKGRKIRL